MNKVLVLLSTYNGVKFLKEQISSLCKQKSVELDVLIRDDNSIDGTIDYIRSISNDNISFYSGENIGAVSSYLDLIERASLEYDYYAFCDQDDVWCDNKLERALYLIKEIKGPALYYSGQIITDEKLKVICEHNLDTKRSKHANCIFNQMAGCTAVFNNALMRQLKEYHPQGISGHDVWCYKVCVALEGTIVVESKGHILYRQHENNVVGLRGDILGKMQRAKNYLFKYNASSYAGEILKGFAQQMSKEQYDFFRNIQDAPKSFKAQIYLMKDKSIKFNSPALRMLFIIKIILGKL